MRWSRGYKSRARNKTLRDFVTVASSLPAHFRANSGAEIKRPGTGLFLRGAAPFGCHLTSGFRFVQPIRRAGRRNSLAWNACETGGVGCETATATQINYSPSSADDLNVPAISE